MENILSIIASDTDGVHADSRLRDSSFVLTGHHCHSCYELFYVEAGKCRFLINDHIFDMHAGDFYLVPPMTLHYTRFVFGDCRRTVILFREKDILEEVRQGLLSADKSFREAGIFQVPEAYRVQVAGCIKQMTSEEKLNDIHSALIRKICLNGLLLLCARVCRFLSELPADIHTTDRQILQAAYFISAHYMNPINAHDIARAAGFSANHLSRKFLQVTGIGLHEYLVFVRLHHAAMELLTTDDSITAIALRNGFSSSNYFKDAFKHKYGVTPRKYRMIK